MSASSLAAAPSPGNAPANTLQPLGSRTNRRSRRNPASLVRRRRCASEVCKRSWPGSWSARPAVRNKLEVIGQEKVRAPSGRPYPREVVPTLRGLSGVPGAAQEMRRGGMRRRSASAGAWPSRPKRRRTVPRSQDILLILRSADRRIDRPSTFSISWRILRPPAT